jgi:hypothetical protein
MAAMSETRSSDQQRTSLDMPAANEVAGAPGLEDNLVRHFASIPNVAPKQVA